MNKMWQFSKIVLFDTLGELKTKSSSGDSDLLEVATPDIIVCQGAPQFSKLVCEPSEASSDNGSHIQWRHFIRILGDEVTQLMPQLSNKVRKHFFFNFSG